MKICFLGICGTFMAGLAIIARQLGHKVVGMDMNVYPPMNEVLKKQGIEIIAGFRAEDLPQCDIYIIGNAMTRGIPAVEKILSNKLSFTSGPQWLAENVLRGRKVIAVAGTHGKTTTSALLGKIFAAGNKKIGYLIAGDLKDFHSHANLGEAQEFVLEADEYDTAFFDKRSKFIHYQPDILLITNLEYDHADIFADMTAIETQFCQLLRTMSQDADVIYLGGNKYLESCIARESHSNYHMVEPSDDYVLKDPRTKESSKDLENAKSINLKSTWRLKKSEDAITIIRSTKTDSPHIDRVNEKSTKGDESFTLSNQALGQGLQGEHNLMNLLFASAASRIAGLSIDDIKSAASNFVGVKRRMELIGSLKGADIISDFAHHPTAIKSSVAAVQAMYLNKGKKIILVLELASNSMRLGVHQDKLLDATEAADQILWFAPKELSWDAKKLAGQRQQKIYNNSEELASKLQSLASSESVILLMSNSSLGGLPEKLIPAA